MNSYELLLPGKSSGKAPVLIVLPILGRFLFAPDFWIERLIARYYARRGFLCAIIRRQFFSYDNARGSNQIGEYIRSTVDLARETLDELLKRPDVNTAQVCSLGVSFGGMINTLLCAEDPRIQAGALVLAGGNIPAILETSKDPLVKDYYRMALAGTGWAPASFASNLAAELREEPLKAAPKIDPKKILMIIAKRDQVVRPEYAEALRRALGRPETHYLPCGHYLSLLALPYLEGLALSFFKRRLG